MQSSLRLAAAPLVVPRGRPRKRLAPQVLLVDDCPLQRLLGLALLSSWRIMPRLARDGREAILLAAQSEFDIILMDLDMPVLDGFAATLGIREHERLAKRRKRVPVVAYTANDSASSERRWLDSGMDAVLAKPSTVADMGECLSRWCPGRLVVGGLARSG